MMSSHKLLVLRGLKLNLLGVCLPAIYCFETLNGGHSSLYDKIPAQPMSQAVSRA